MSGKLPACDRPEAGSMARLQKRAPAWTASPAIRVGSPSAKDWGAGAKSLPLDA